MQKLQVINFRGIIRLMVLWNDVHVRLTRETGSIAKLIGRPSWRGSLAANRYSIPFLIGWSHAPNGSGSVSATRCDRTANIRTAEWSRSWVPTATTNATCTNGRLLSCNGSAGGGLSRSRRGRAGGLRRGSWSHRTTFAVAGGSVIIRRMYRKAWIFGLNKSKSSVFYVHKLWRVLKEIILKKFWDQLQVKG